MTPQENGSVLWAVKRTDPRVSLRIPIRVTGKDVWGVDFVEDAFTENVSRHGACVETGHQLKVGMQIQVAAFEDQFKADARVEVVWSRKSLSEKFKVGLRFVETSGNWLIQ